MTEQSLSYYALALGFSFFLNLVVVIAIAISYFTSRREYLRIACFAGLVELLRQGFDITLSLSPDSLTLYLLSKVFQFGSTLLFTAALLMVFERVTRIYYWIFGALGIGLVLAMGISLTTPETVELTNSYIFTAPLNLLTLLLFIRTLLTGPGITPSKVFLVVPSLVLLISRSLLPSMPLNEFYLFMYYMEYLCFAILMMAIALFELEFANRQVNTLLDQRTRSEQDLQFIVDNSLDVILITDKVGLLQSWSNKAQEIFGYAADQVVGKIHMDDLFSSNYWGRDIGQQERFTTEMENVDGAKFPVEVRMREVSEAGSNYCVFVVNVLNLGSASQDTLEA